MPYNLSKLANSFGTPAFRNRLLELAGRFNCTDELENRPLALLSASVILLAKFETGSSEKLRAHLSSILNSSVDPNYRSFIISCYLSSLLAHSSSINQQDLELIGVLKGNFTTTHLWLEALLVKKLKS